VRDSIVVARDEGAQRLMLLFHGVAATAANLEPIAKILAQRFAPAFVVSVGAPFDHDRGPGRQWFSVQGINDDKRIARAAAAMPLFIAAVKHWQGEARLGPAATTLLGFSQGAIMSLESLHGPQALAGRVVAIAGRFAAYPQLLPSALRVNLIHGKRDRVISSSLSQQAFETLAALGCEVSLDLISKLGHVLDERIVERILYRMGA
jgi:phospholipase/carboxylesterase